jgi:hypothetical protein
LQLLTVLLVCYFFLLLFRHAPHFATDSDSDDDDHTDHQSTSLPTTSIIGRQWVRKTRELLQQQLKFEAFQHLAAVLSVDQRRALGWKENAEQQYAMQAAQLKSHIKNRRRSMHRTVVSDLLARYDVLLWPILDVASLIRRENRKFGASLTRLALYGIGHGELRRYAVQQAAACAGKRIVDATEAWSTVTCSKCGNRRPSFPGETFYCTNEGCGHEQNRDANSAVNIFKFNLWHLIIAPLPAASAPP